MKELVDFIRDTTKFQQLGGKIPRGEILMGHPGNGNTLRARAVTGAA